VGCFRADLLFSPQKRHSAPEMRIYKSEKEGQGYTSVQVCIFKSVQNLAYFFIFQYNFFHLQRGDSGARPPKYDPGTVALFLKNLSLIYT